MILTIDVGNTSTACAVFRNRSIIYRRAMPTPKRWRSGLLASLVRKGLAAGIEAVVVSSVVPALDGALASDSIKNLGLAAIFLDHRSVTGMRLKIDKPAELGADRIADCLGALTIYPPPLMVIDSGTAITFDLLNGKNEYRGGCILPGIGIAVKSLAENTAKLKQVAFAVPVSPLGTNTADCIRAGIFFGYSGMLTHLIGLYRRLLGPGTMVIATGGLIRHFRGQVHGIDRFEPDLIFLGLKSFYDRRLRSR